MSKGIDIRAAEQERDMERFMRVMFPAEWSPIIRVILETGAEFTDDPVTWAPRWSKIHRTVKPDPDPFRRAVRSCMYRSHDCLHQIWGLPKPINYTTGEFYHYKRGQMCGEVAVLILTELRLAQHLWHALPQAHDLLLERGGVTLMDTVLVGKSWEDVASRMDATLHLGVLPKWARSSSAMQEFIADYKPMLEGDREEIDHNWALLKANEWDPSGIPEQRYPAVLDGRELTVWMMRDFDHILQSGDRVDRALQRFNQARRRRIVLPKGWGDLS